MLPGILSRINWIDVFVVMLFIRISYVALKTGFPIELFKLLGAFLSVYLAMHYYTSLSSSLAQKLNLKTLSAEVLNFAAFIFLAVLGYLVFMFLRVIFCRFIKMDAVPGLNRWGALLLGMARGFLLASLILYIFVISPLAYFGDSLEKSYCAKGIFKIAPFAYRAAWDGVASKFFTGEKVNETVLENSGFFSQKQKASR